MLWFCYTCSGKIIRGCTQEYVDHDIVLFPSFDQETVFFEFGLGIILIIFPFSETGKYNIEEGWQIIWWNVV